MGMGNNGNHLCQQEHVPLMSIAVGAHLNVNVPDVCNEEPCAAGDHIVPNALLEKMENVAKIKMGYRKQEAPFAFVMFELGRQKDNIDLFV